LELKIGFGILAFFKNQGIFFLLILSFSTKGHIFKWILRFGHSSRDGGIYGCGPNLGGGPQFYFPFGRRFGGSQPGRRNLVRAPWGGPSKGGPPRTPRGGEP